MRISPVITDSRYYGIAATNTFQKQMGYSKTPIFWQWSATSMKFLPGAIKNHVRLARFLKKKLNFTTKSLPVVKFTVVREGTWKCPCTLRCVVQEGTWKFPCTLTCVVQEGTWKFPGTLTCVVQEGPWKFPCTVACVLQVLLFTCVTFERNHAFR